MKVVYIMRGVPGSGKSTIAKHIAGGLGGVIVSADDYFIKGGVYRYDPTLIGKAHEYCQSQFLKALNKFQTIVVDNTNIRSRDFEFYTAQALANGYLVTIIEVRTALTPDELAKRNVHGVPADKIKTMLEVLSREST